MLRNPVIPGFYPDPSICRVGEDYYLANSSFSLFPGIPLWHSRDLAHWAPIGCALDRRSQLRVEPESLVAGLMAPTLRHHAGTFHLVGTNFSDRGNFIVTAKDPRGPWSEPHWLPDFPGIDPSLFFDDDGRAYLTGTRRDPKPDGSPGPQVIWLSELDLATFRCVGPAPTLWGGALVDAATPEGPHLYKKDGWYYLLIAEGGTEHFHAVTVARSRRVDGPYEGYAGNPVLTHRHLGRDYPFCNIGHADLVEAPDGSWHAVMLGSRLIGGYHKTLGRETFYVPVAWEDGWPVFSPGTGRVEAEYPDPLPPVPVPAAPVRDAFDGPGLGPDWTFFGTPPEPPFHRVGGGRLELDLLPRPLCAPIPPMRHGPPPEARPPALAAVLVRQRAPSCRVAARLDFRAATGAEAAGLVVMQAMNHQYRLERGSTDGRQVVRVVLATTAFTGYPHLPGFTHETTETVLASAPLADGGAGPVALEIDLRGQDFAFRYAEGDGPLRTLLAHADGRLIQPEKVGGMVGTMIGPYATANGTASANRAAFLGFDLEEGDAWTLG